MAEYKYEKIEGSKAKRLVMVKSNEDQAKAKAAEKAAALAKESKEKKSSK